MGLFFLEVLVGGFESARHDGFVTLIEVDEGHTHPAPSSRDRGEDCGLVGDEGLLLFGRELEHPAAVGLAG